jgi:hypothetical protein
MLANDTVYRRSVEESSEGRAFFSLTKAPKEISWSNEVATDPAIPHKSGVLLYFSGPFLL